VVLGVLAASAAWIRIGARQRKAEANADVATRID